MHLARWWFVLALLVLVAAVPTGCGGGGVTTTSVGTPLPTATVSTTPTTSSPGQTATATFTNAGGTLALGPYANAAGTTVSLSSTWGANDQYSSTVEGWLSSGNSDVNPSDASITWTPYTGSGLVIYLEFAVTQAPAVVFTASPQLTFTVNGTVSGSGCTLYTLNSGTWQALLTGGTLSAGSTSTITFASQAPSFSVGDVGGTYMPDYLALVCQ